MSVPMRKHPINQVEITVHSNQTHRFVGPKRKLKPLLTLITEFDFKAVKKKHRDEATRIPWEELAKDELEKYGSPALALRGARARDGMSQAVLAKKLGIAQYNVSKMENGTRPIGKKMAKRLARIFKTNYRVFL